MSDQEQSTDEIRSSFAAGYDLERELLGGGMSRVFLANERALNRKVVIKILPPELAAGVNQERFRREVQLAAQLQHPHIVPLYSAGSQGNLLYYTMPFIEGESLRHALEEKKRFTPREVLRILHDVVDALGYAHTRGVIHRDIKPGNVLRSGSHAVVTDFGVAKAISAAMPAVGMTGSGMVVGSPAYMAPEQLAGDPKADHRVDLYAVGLLAYELLSGETPFHSPSPQETMAAQLTRTPAPLENVRRDIPPALSAIIMKCLAKRPEDRPQSAAELLAALDAIQIASGEYAAAAAARRPWLVLAAAGVILGTIAVWQRAGSGARPMPAARDTVTVSSAGPLLTRAESLAIAKAVEARVAEQREARRASDSSSHARGGAGTPAGIPTSADAFRRMADSIRSDIERAVFDSLSRAQANQTADNRARGGFNPRSPGAGGGPGTRVFVEGRSGGNPVRVGGIAPELDSMLRNMDPSARHGNSLDAVQFARRAATLGPPRRVVVTEPRTFGRSMAPAAPVGAALVDTIRKAIGASKRFVVVDPDSVRAALQQSRTIDDLAKALNADVFASVSAFRTQGDSVMWQVMVRDLTANSAYATRSWTTPPIVTGAAIPDLGMLAAKTAAQLTEMDLAPRKLPPDTTAGGPLSHEAFDRRAANMGGPRRLIVWTHPPDGVHPELIGEGTAVTDLIRRSLSANPRYVVVPTDETLSVLARTRSRDQVYQATHAELMVTIRGYVQRDSLLWTVTAWDLGAFGTYQQRSVNAGRVPLNAPMMRTDSLARAVANTIDVLDHAPRASDARP